MKGCPEGVRSIPDLSLPHFKALLVKASASSAPIISSHQPVLQTGKTEAAFCSLAQGATDPLIQASGAASPVGFSWLILG